MKIVRYLVLLILILPIVTACMGDDDDDADEPTATAVADATAEDDPTATAAEDGEATSTEAVETEVVDEETATEGPDPTAAEGTPEARFTPTPVVSFEESSIAFGWNIALRADDQGDPHNAQVAETVQDSGFGWVRFQIEWFRIEPQQGQWDPTAYDRLIDTISDAGLNILIVIAKPPDWAVSPEPDQFLVDPEDVGNLMAYVADRYRGKVQAWEIWNEQNLAYEVGGWVDVDEYIDMLRSAAEGVRASDPDALVVFGGLTPNGIMDPAIAIDDFNYLNLAYMRSGGEISQYFDVLGVHANSTHNSPDENWPGPITSGHEGWNDHPSFFYRRVEQLRSVMVDQGDIDKPVWITEFGWTTANQAPGYEYGANNTDEDVAEYLTRSLEICVDEWSWCTGAFVWNLNWSTLVAESDEKYPWSAVLGDWTPRPAFEAMRDFPKN